MQIQISKTSQIQCEWVPGTMNQVRVFISKDEMQVSLEQLQNVAGKDAVHELYLKGLISLPFSTRLRDALNKLQLQR